MEFIQVPKNLHIANQQNNMKAIADATFLDLLSNYTDESYLTKRAILTPNNEIVLEINDIILDILLGERTHLFNSDTIYQVASSNTDEDS